MGFAGEDELYRELLVVDDLRQTLQVGEEKMSALVGGEAAGKADNQCVGIDFVDNLHN